jgi:hypothetical protein
LLSLGFDAFVAHEDIEPSRQWREAIEEALATCHALVAYVTPDFRESNWCSQEVGWALGRGVAVLPVRAGADPYGFFGAIQAVNEGGRADVPIAVDIAGALTTDILRRGPSRVQAILAEALVTAFCQSRSFDGTRARYGLLARLPRSLITQEMAERLGSACSENRQVLDAVVDAPSPSPAPQAISTLLAIGR